MKPLADAGSRLAGDRGLTVLSLGSGVLQNFLGKASQILASILLAAALVRFLGLGPYGIWALLQFLVGPSMLLDFGMAGYVEWAVATDLTSGARGRGAAALKLARLVCCGLSLLLAGGLAVFRAPLVNWLSRDLDAGDARALLAILPLAFFVVSQGLIVEAGLSGLLRLRILNVTRSLGACSRVVVLLVALVVGVRWITALVGLLALVSGLWTLLMWTALRKHLARFTAGSAVTVRQEWRRALGFAGSIQGSALALVCGEQGIRVVLAVLFGAAAAGAYDLAYRIGLLPRTLASVAATTLIPYVASVPEAERPERLSRVYSKSLLLFSLLLIPASAAVFSLADALWTVWVGASSWAGAVLVRTLTLMHLAGAWMTVDAMVCRALGRPTAETVAMVVPYALGLALSALLGVTLGIAGMVGLMAALNVLAAGAYRWDVRARFGLVASADVTREIRKVGGVFLLAAAFDLLSSRILSVDGALPSVLLLIRLQWYLIPAIWLLRRVPAYREKLATP